MDEDYSLPKEFQNLKNFVGFGTNGSYRIFTDAILTAQTIADSFLSYAKSYNKKYK